jgi:hypothetical protein
LGAIGKPAGAGRREVRKIGSKDTGEFPAACAAREREYGVTGSADPPRQRRAVIAA